MGEPGRSFEISTDVFFGMVNGLITIIVVAAAVTISVRLRRTWQPKHQQRAVDDLSQKMNLAVPDHVREPLARAIAARKRGSDVAGLVSLCAFLLILRPWSAPLPDLGVVGVIPAIMAGSLAITLGTVIGGLFARRTATTEHRAARLTPLNFSDLIASLDRRFLVGALSAGAILPATLTVLMFAPWPNRSLISTTEVLLLLLAGLLAAGLGLALPRIGRWLVSRRAIPGDEHALAWSDALAARILRDIAHLAATVGSLVGFMSFMAIGLAFPASWENIADAWISSAPLLILGAVVALVLVTTHGQPERHVQRTLWPQFAADAQ